MGEQRQRTRSKVEDLPAELKAKVESMLLDLRYTYEDITEYLKSKGYDFKKSDLGRYARMTQK